MPFPDQKEILLPWIQRARFIAIDATGLGGPVSEHLAKRLGEYKLEGVTFTNERKRELFSRAKKAFQARQLRIPADSRLRDDLASIQQIVTPQGLVKFIAARTRDGHADRATALALALHAGRQCQPSNLGGGMVAMCEVAHCRRNGTRRTRFRKAWSGGAG